MIGKIAKIKLMIVLKQLQILEVSTPLKYRLFLSDLKDH